MFLASHHPLQPADLQDAFTIFEQAILGVPPDQISFGYTSELASQIAEIAPEPCPLSRHVSLIGHRPDAPGWVYDIATWRAGRTCPGRRRVQGGRAGDPVRMDTNGDLLVWDNDLLWPGSWGDRIPPGTPRCGSSYG